MSFDPQNKLERSLVQAASDPAHRPQFYRDLVESDLFVVEEGPPPERAGKTMLETGQTLRLRHLEWNGKPYLPVFSSLARLQAAIREEVGYLSLNALEFMKITQGADLLLNPGSDFGKEFTKEEIASLLDGSMWTPHESYVEKKGSEVMIGQPANYPSELAEALIRYFKKTREVKRAYLAHFFHPGRDEKPHTLIGLEVSGNWEAVMAGAGMIARDVPVPDPPVDFIQITGKGGVEDYFTKESTPFYRRKLFGLI